MKVISSQHYINEEIVAEKVEEMKAAEMMEIILNCWNAGEVDGEEMAVLADGHHTLEAARELGIEVKFEVTEHPEYLTGEKLMEVAWMDGDWYDVANSDPINGQYDLVW